MVRQRAKEAAKLYISIFRDSKIKSVNEIYNTPSGTVDILTIQISGQEFTFLNAGPLFKFNPSVSFLVACSSKDEVDALWRNLSQSGTALMDLGQYPFSQKYGWIQDRFGLSWQVMFTGDREIKQKITPTLLFT